MRKFILVIFSVVFVNSIFGQYSLGVDTVRLNAAYCKLVKEPNVPERQKAFFDAFPDTWMGYVMTYQYTLNKKSNRSLYDVAADHVDALRDKMASIPDSVYCKKIVRIALGGVWDADTPNYFKGVLKAAVKNKRDCMFRTIAQLRKGHQMQFWQFYWSNIVRSKPLEDEFNSLKAWSEKRYPDETKVMNVAFDYFYIGIDPIYLSK